MTGQGTYCYQVMPFGLKPAGSTYERLVNKMLQKHIGTSMEVYIDDMLVKSVKAELHVNHLAKAFKVLKCYKMKLNLTKCAFGVLLIRPKHVHKLTTLLPRDYCLIPGNGAIKLVDPTKTCTQANDTAAKGLLSNPRQRHHKTC